MIQRGHQLLTLARRLPSSIHIQLLLEHPELCGETVVIRDTDGVLYMPGDSDNRGFYEPGSRASTQSHLEKFDEFWQRSAVATELRQLGL